MKRGNEKFELSIWVYLLRFVAGYINALTVLNFSQMLAGQTGNLTSSVLSFISGDFQGMATIILMVSCFFLGTVVSGIIFPESQIIEKNKYGVAMFVLGIVLILIHLFDIPPELFLIYIAFSLGFQNAMFVYHRKSIVRTTILTGTLTDIGVALGRKLKGIKKDQDVIFDINNVLFFLIGAIVAGFIFFYTSNNMVLIGGVIYILIGIYFIL